MKLKISTTLLSELEKIDSKECDNYTFEKNSNGYIIATKDKRLIHSKYSVENEAKNSIADIDNNTKAVIFYGFGLSYVVKYFIENRDTRNIKIIIVVNDCYLFQYFYNNMEVELFESENIFFISEKDNSDFVFSILAESNIFNFKFISLQSLTQKEKELSIVYKTKLLNIIQTYIADILTRLNFENLWLKNIIYNSLYLEQSADISLFKNSCNGFNALLVCAGPTLENSIDMIKKNRESFIIIAVDTAYSILSKNSIIADFIITADAGFYNALDFVYEGSNFSFLVMDLITNKKIPTMTENRADIITFSSTKSLSIIRDIEYNFNIEIDELFLGSTVATAMLDFAYYLGFKKVLLVGFDNSYPYYYTHNKHALSYEYKINNTNKLSTIESYYFDIINNSSDISSYPPHSYVLGNQTDFLTTVGNRYKDMKIKRLKLNAIEIENIESGSISDIALLGSREKILANFKRLYKKNSVDKNTIREYYNRTISTLSEFNNILYNLYNELIENKNNVSEIENKTETIINEYLKKLPLIENILNTVKTISKLKNSDILFLITEAIKTVNYFKTRINIILEKLENEK